MQTQSPSLWPTRTAARTGLIVTALASVFFVGWVGDIDALKNFQTSRPVVASPATSLGMFLAGLSLWLIGRYQALGAKSDARIRLAGLVTALAICGLAAARLAAFAFGQDTGLDRLWIVVADHRDLPVRMPPVTASSLFLLGVSLFLASQRTYRSAQQLFAFAANLIGWLSFVHFLYGGEPLLPVAPMAAHTALGFVALSFGSMMVRTDGGLGPLLSSRTEGGRLIRHLLPASIFAPLLIGWLRLQGQKAGWFGTEAGVALFAITNAVLLAIVIWRTALRQERDEIARKRTEQTLRFHESVLRETGQIAKVGGWHFDPRSGEGFWTEEVARIHDLPEGTPICMADGLKYYAGESRARIEAAVKAVVDHAIPYDLELEIKTATGRSKWVRTIGHPIVEEGQVVQVRGSFQDITELRQANAARLRMAGIVQGMTEACLALDSEWRFTFVNDRGEQIMHYKREELLGQTIWEKLPQLLGTATEEHYRRAMRDRVPVSFETFSPVAKRWLDIRIFPSGDGLAAFLLDIHARKEAEASMRMFRVLMDQTQDCIEVVDPKTARILDVNDAACRRHGYSRAEYLQLSVFDVDHGVDPTRFASIAQRLSEVGSMTIEETHRKRDGSPFPVELSLSYVRLDRDYIVAVARDISARKQAEVALRESQERFRQVVENIHEVFWMTDVRKHEILYISPGYEKIWGRSCESLYKNSQSWIENIHPEDRPRISAALSKQVEGGYEETYRIKRPDGTIRWIRDMAFPVKEADGSVVRVVGVAEDITEKKNLEAQFLRGQRLEAVGTLSSGIAHDLNNILAPLLMIVPLLREKLPDERDASMLDVVEQSTQRGAGIIRQLLTFSRGIDGKRGPIEAKHLVREVVSMMQETFPREIEIVSNVPAQLWPVLGDATQLHQVLLNLCVNARDAMPNGGRISLAAQNATVEKGEIAQHPEAKPGQYVMLSVTDTGQGIAAENIARIFEPFFTTKEIGKGTGLGLSTVLGIVKSHGGFVTVYSEMGRGSVFKVYLPHDPTRVAKVAAAPAALARGNQELILVVDDEAAVRVSLCRLLEKHNYRVLEAANAGEAITLFGQHQSEIKLLFTDLMMPGMSGVALIRTLRASHPHLKVIAATGLNDRERRDELTQMNVTDVLDKPCGPAQVLDTLRQKLSAK